MHKAISLIFSNRIPSNATEVNSTKYIRCHMRSVYDLNFESNTLPIEFYLQTTVGSNPAEGTPICALRCHSGNT
jgi:hypothetical protein